MKNTEKKISASQIAVNMAKTDSANGRFYDAALKETDEIFAELNTSPKGLNEEMVDEMRGLYGANKISHGKRKSLASRIFEAFVIHLRRFCLFLPLFPWLQTCFWRPRAAKIR